MRRARAVRVGATSLALLATLDLWPAALAAQPSSPSPSETPPAPIEAARADAETTTTTPSAPAEASPSIGAATHEDSADAAPVGAVEPIDEVTSSAEVSPAPRVRVHVRARRPGVEAHVRLGSHVVTTDGIARVADDYTLLCAPAPCDADVPSGVHLFAVSGTAGRALPVRELDLTPGLEHTLSIDLDDRSGWRTLGWVATLLVGIPGLVVLLVSLIGPAAAKGGGPVDAVFVASGASLTAIGVAALPLAAWGDTRVVELDE